MYAYDRIPDPLKVQVIHIWRETLGDERSYFDQYRETWSKKAYQLVVEALCKEYGVFVLPGTKSYDRNYLKELADFLLQEQDSERAVDAIELSFRAIDNLTRRFDYLGRSNANELADEAISELNARFLEHGVGYAFDSGEIIRIDSGFLHAEAVKPALACCGSPSTLAPRRSF